MTMSEGQTLMPGDVLATGTVSPESCSIDVQMISLNFLANFFHFSLQELALAAVHRSISSPATKSPSPSLALAA